MGENIVQINSLKQGKGILDVLNKQDLPDSVKGYVRRLKGKFSVFNDLYRLKWDLEKALKMPLIEHKEEKYFIILFLGLVYYFLEDENKNNAKRSLEYLNESILKTREIIRDPEKSRLILGMLVSLKHRLTKLDKILFLVDPDLATKEYLRSIRRHYSKYVNIKWVAMFDDAKFHEALRDYEQLFIFAHGDEEGTYLGGKKITSRWLVNSLKLPGMQLGVLGVFSCQESLGQSDVMNHVDYFITDSFSSSPDFNEMFSYGYIHNYLKSWRIYDSFEIGKLGPVFRTNSNPGLQLYEGGSLIST